MAELVYQTWERITGRPWSDARAGGFTTGSYNDNIALQKRLLGGWDPYAPAAPAAARPAVPRAAPPAAPPAISPELTKLIESLSVPVQPGLTAEQFADELALGEATLAETIRAAKAAEDTSRRLEESRLAANPADFVAYELYKRSLVDQGFTPEGAVRSDLEIQELVDVALGLNAGDTAGTGRFGVDIPTTGSISRSELQSFNPTDIGILSSFLRGGVDTGRGEFQGINPEDFFTELEEGLVPVLPGQRTQFVF